MVVGCGECIRCTVGEDVNMLFKIYRLLQYKSDTQLVSELSDEFLANLLGSMDGVLTLGDGGHLG